MAELTPKMATEFREGMASRGKKDSILNLSKYLDKAVRVKISGGREVVGVLKGFDPLLNLVLDETVESLRGAARERAQHADPADLGRLSGQTRTLGLVVCRGPQVMLICPEDGFEEIENPFLGLQGAEDAPALGAE